MQEKHLHIIALNVPYPPDYGGVIDLWYKLPALRDAGVLIHLHCFDYGRGPADELLAHCESVWYYPRNTGHQGISNTLPYIVASRRSELLVQRLLQDNYPILMEGIHCTFLVQDTRLQGRQFFVRLHNVEYRYYAAIGRHTRSLLRKLYYRIESYLLKKYEKRIAGLACFLAVSEADLKVYQDSFNCRQVRLLPLFIPDWHVQCQEGMGTYCLYHGDLSIDANEQAVRWLLTQVFAGLQLPFVIAGRNPSAGLQQLVAANKHCCLVANPSESALQDMLIRAHIHVLPSFTNTGIKWKLLYALYHGRHVVANQATVTGSGLEAACHIVETADAFRDQIEELYHQPFGDPDLQLRRSVLSNQFDNARNARSLCTCIWDTPSS
ncbi:MAG TPA: glycosyltransferase [Sediminibacterium sp.]|nr:glycosyltransferase [Sediminibacterium sp.]